MKSRFAALLLAAIMTLSLVACGQQPAENTASTSEPDTIVEQPSIPEGVLATAEQVMFSAGGTVITSDGTFDVSNYYTPEKVPLPMWIMPMCFTKFPQRRLACPWYFFMATVSPVWVG